MIMVKHELFIELFIEHNIFRKTSTMYVSLWPKWVWHINVCVCGSSMCASLDLESQPHSKSRSRATATFQV